MVMRTNILLEALEHKKDILQGTILAIDPSSGGSSPIGYAMFKKGKLTYSGSYMPAHRRMGQRLFDIQEHLRCLFGSGKDIDIVVVEKIRCQGYMEKLVWSIGAILAAFGSTPNIIELHMPIQSWKKLAGPSHIKSDEADAIAIGQCLIALAQVSSNPPRQVRAKTRVVKAKSRLLGHTSKTKKRKKKKPTS